MIAGAHRLRRTRGRVLRARWRPGPRTVLALIAVTAALAGGWFWLRDSSLVAIRRVTISGASGPDAAAIKAALRTAARTMTTLDVQVNRLHTAVAPFPVVKGLRVSTDFPHGIRIAVLEQLPVGLVTVDGRTVAVSGDGILLHDGRANAQLPRIPLQAPPGGPRVTDPAALGALRMVAAAPWQLLGRIGQASTMPGHGLAAALRNGPVIYFGDASDLAAKWTAATLVLAAQSSAGAAYIDVSDPRRPAAGAPAAAASAAAAAPAAAPPPASSSATGAGASGGAGG